MRTARVVWVAGCVACVALVAPCGLEASRPGGGFLVLAVQLALIMALFVYGARRRRAETTARRREDSDRRVVDTPSGLSSRVPAGSTLSFVNDAYVRFRKHTARGRLLAWRFIVRDDAQSKQVVASNRDLAGRLIASQEVERTRIARELHDGVCQDVAAVSVDVSHLRQSGGDIHSREVQDVLLAIERRTASIAESLRLLSHGLHPSVLHHIGLVAALQAHCTETERRHRMQVSFFAEGDVEPPTPMVALSLFRIAQEALRNAARHGHARNVTVSLARRRAALVLTVADDGEGFDPSAVRLKEGLGLVSIVERARLVRGHAVIRSEPGGGTTIDVRVPLGGLDPSRRRSPGEASHTRRARPSSEITP